MHPDLYNKTYFEQYKDFKNQISYKANKNNFFENIIIITSYKAIETFKPYYIYAQ